MPLLEAGNFAEAMPMGGHPAAGRGGDGASAPALPIHDVLTGGSELGQSRQVRAGI